MKRLLPIAIYTLSGLVGVVAFAYPFFLPEIVHLSPGAADGAAGLRLADAPVLTTILLILCLLVLLVEIQGQAVSVKVVAALGILVAITSALRFLEVAAPGPGGFTPIFAPLILAGYVFGPRFGFLMGALTLLVSALITGGVGPWLPYQMFAAGWVGLTAGWLPHWPRPRLTLALLALFGFAWGLLFGAIMNLYFWPFVVGNDPTLWRPGSGLAESLARYAAFYLTTSLWWDLAGAAGNAVLLLALGRPVIRALTRFRDRFHFHSTGFTGLTG
ncbi:MAG: ECF transporter S component [Chloroflexota bacterium]